MLSPQVNEARKLHPAARSNSQLLPVGTVLHRHPSLIGSGRGEAEQNFRCQAQLGVN